MSGVSTIGLSSVWIMDEFSTTGISVTDDLRLILQVSWNHETLANKQNIKQLSKFDLLNCYSNESSYTFVNTCCECDDK